MLVNDFTLVDDCDIVMPVDKSLVVSVSITGPNIPPPTVSLKPSETVVFTSVPLLLLELLSFEKLNVEPFSILAELPEPGGSRKMKSGICGPAVTKVCEPSASPPIKIPSVLYPFTG
ncbi:hypothetical protein D3C85_1386420 [compost metagenome]